MANPAVSHIRRWAPSSHHACHFQPIPIRWPNPGPEQPASANSGPRPTWQWPRLAILRHCPGKPWDSAWFAPSGAPASGWSAWARTTGSSHWSQGRGKHKLAQIEFSCIRGFILLVQVRVAVELGVQIEANIITPAAATCEFEEHQKLYYNPYLARLRFLLDLNCYHRVTLSTTINDLKPLTSNMCLGQNKFCEEFLACDICKANL